MDTDTLIAELARNAEPVRRLRPAWMRAILWLALALPPVVIVVMMDRSEGALSQFLSDRRTQIELAAILATALTRGHLRAEFDRTGHQPQMVPRAPLAARGLAREPRQILRVGLAALRRCEPAAARRWPLLPAHGVDGRHPDLGDPRHAPPRRPADAAGGAFLCCARRRGARQFWAAPRSRLRRVDHGSRLEFRDRRPDLAGCRPPRLAHPRLAAGAHGDGAPPRPGRRADRHVNGVA